MNPDTKQPASPPLPAKDGSGRRRRCQWLMKLKGWNDCGRKVTHIRSDCGLAYCDEHARLLMPYTAFQPIAPNDKLSGGANTHD